MKHLKLFEVGEASAKPFAWAPAWWTLDAFKNNKNEDEYVYQFHTEHDIYYSVVFAKARIFRANDKGHQALANGYYHLTFYAKEKDDIQRTAWETNRGDMYRVMATIVACIKDFMNSVDVAGVEFTGEGKEKENDDSSVITQRTRMYMAYVNKMLSNDDEYTIHNEHNEIIIYKKVNELPVKKEEPKNYFGATMRESIMMFEDYNPNDQGEIDHEKFNRFANNSIDFLKKMKRGIELLRPEIIKVTYREDAKELLTKLYDAQFDDWQQIHGLWEEHSTKNSGAYFWKIFGDTNAGELMDKKLKEKDPGAKELFKLTRSIDKFTEFSRQMWEVVRWLAAFKFGIIHPLANALDCIGIGVKGFQGSLHPMSQAHEFWPDKYDQALIKRYVNEVSTDRIDKVIEMIKEMQKIK